MEIRNLRMLLWASFLLAMLVALSSVPTAHVAAAEAEDKFQLLDQDQNGSLSEEEFTAEVSLPEERLRRDFKLMDVNRDGKLIVTEFIALPYWVPPNQRGAFPDPVSLLAESRFNEFDANLPKWDEDKNGKLNAGEFKKAAPGQDVPGLESFGFKVWDLNQDGMVSRNEAKSVFQIAFGVTTPEGELLRMPTARVVDWRLFRQFKLDKGGFVHQDAYLQALGAMPPKEKATWLATTDQNHDGKFNYAEFAKSEHRTDPIGTFINTDIDLNGRLTLDELEKLPADPLIDFLLGAFDDDKDKGLSLPEYQLTPPVNLLAHWQSVSDSDGNGSISLNEFRFYDGLALSALAAEYFRRFDLNDDQKLSRNEFPFARHPNSPYELEIHVVAADDSTTVIAIPDYPNIFSPEISPDGKWVAVDGWRAGENNGQAHLLIANVDTDEVRDLGIGCIPSWSADGRKIAYSKYGRGVFIRGIDEAPGDEDSIDKQGWSLEFAPDGLKAAYVKGADFVIYNLKTREKRSVFGNGKSPYNYIVHNYSWSPDSERISFKGQRMNGGEELGIVTVTGNDPQLKVRGAGEDVQNDLSWVEPRKLMYPHVPPGEQYSQIFEIDPDGDQPAVRYPRQPKRRHNGGLCWSRDGKTFVFMSRP